MQPTFININGTLINLSQVAYLSLSKSGLWICFTAMNDEHGELYQRFDESPATRAAWEYLSTKIPIAKFTDDETDESEEPKS